MHARYWPTATSSARAVGAAEELGNSVLPIDELEMVPVPN